MLGLGPAGFAVGAIPEGVAGAGGGSGPLVGGDLGEHLGFLDGDVVAGGIDVADVAGGEGGGGNLGGIDGVNDGGVLEGGVADFPEAGLGVGAAGGKHQGKCGEEE